MHYITDIEQLRFFIDQAIREAKNSGCKKSQRGAIVADEIGNVIGRGYNMPTLPGICCMRKDIRDNGRVERCTAIHAEQMAILNALERRESLKGLTLYHIKVKEGEAVPSGHPSCTVCGRIIGFVGVRTVLWHKEGYALYYPEEFNELSFRYFLEKSQKEP